MVARPQRTTTLDFDEPVRLVRDGAEEGYDMSTTRVSMEPPWSQHLPWILIVAGIWMAACGGKDGDKSDASAADGSGGANAAAAGAGKGSTAAKGNGGTDVDGSGGRHVTGGASGAGG